MHALLHIYTQANTYRIAGNFCEKCFANFVNTSQFVTISYHEHFALAKLHSSLSMIVPTSTILAVNEVVRKTIENNTDPGVQKTLIILMNRIHLSAGHFMT